MTDKDVADEKDYDVGLKKRLNELVDRSSQAEFSRKVGISHQNISRYLKGGKPPASFCGRVIEKLGVNPAWLMMGEGSPMLSDVTTGTSQMAGDILELVKAMGEVTEMRLGALSGKEHLSVLRNLNDALKRYETLRTKLNKHSLTIFEQLASDLGDALTNVEHDRARALIAAGDQVARLCDNIELEQEYNLQKATYYYREGKLDEVVGLLRRTMNQYLLINKAPTENACRDAGGLAMTLSLSLRYAQAQDICDVYLVLTRDTGADYESTHRLRCLSAHYDVQRGDISKALKTISSAHAKLSLDVRKRISGILFSEALFLSGLMDYWEAKNVETLDVTMAPQMAMHALWTEGIDQLKDVRMFYTNVKEEVWAKGDLLRLYSEYVLRSTETKKMSLVGELEKQIADRASLSLLRVYNKYTLPIISAQMAGLMKTKGLQESHLKAEEVLHNAPPEITLPIIFQAIHQRNALRAIPESTRSSKLSSLRTQAQSFFDKHYAAGYEVFKEYVTQSTT